MPPDFSYELNVLAAGACRVAGVDEAGRGPLAGPVTVAAVVLPSGFSAPGLDDSKKLPPAARERLFDLITGHAGVLWAIELVHAAEIDRLNILRATHEGMRRAIQAIHPNPDHALIDGLPVVPFPVPCTAIIRGDSKVMSIAAASVLAKVARDRIMLELDRAYPQYGFAKHKGYGTATHLQALADHGPCPEHRRSFAPVRDAARDYP